MVAEEVTRVVDVPFAIVVRYEDDDTATDCASFPPSPEISTAGMRWSLGGTNVRSLVRKSSAPARIDDYSQLEGELADHARRVGYNSSAGVPITVAGRLWGAMIVSTSDPLPGDTEERLARFTELLAAAIANAESRAALGRLAEQQAGLRRVATLVARATQPAEIFDAVVDEIRRCMDAMTAGLWRFETSGELTLLASAAGDPALLTKWPVGTRTPVEGNTLASMVQRTGRPARMDDYENVAGAVADRVRTVGVRAAVGVPVIVNDGLWGLAAVGSIDPPRCPPTPRCACRTSPIWSRPRSPTRPRATSCWPRAPALSRPPMMRAAGSNATCTTALNSGWLRWALSCGPRKRTCLPICSHSRSGSLGW